ncbi:alkyl hydroperoxide reductase AhpD [Mycolicibacterium arabiense]|uniref:Alkyl hydroperoxide reductase AhpD n=1 Tax=Mycolicibacterium arabiense TaxID=1286181 RepID=A0A7I7S0T7_9MYCO|nr:carboxymuconolactone decarboxylase family protein [Mycolicibacterium arabiense]MCV7371811.1 carboxymuconolactone decarboxylase family protein [Mycolicibacterium arabiense]BBY50524.1 alkyl hydroperoxide reductase AhpD [Mycolicibacterium arabiense]
MSRIDLVDTEGVTDDRAEPLEQIKAAFGFVPNMFRAAANSPAALQSLWGSFGALSQGTLDAKVGEQIAVAIADRNRCDYCLSAHTLLGKKAGATADEMADAQKGYSSDAKTAAILALATELVDRRGQVDDDAIAAARNAGLTSEEIVETVAHVALNVFTNYVNVALDVPVDFTRTRLTQKA